MRTEQLYYLITVARCGSMNKAAKDLFMTQPALSAAISSLEKEIGTVLIKRKKQGIVLTEAGKKVYDDALNILDNIHNWSHLTEITTDLTDSISISAFETVSYLILPSVVSDLTQDYPNLRIVMDNYISEQALFYDDQFDIVITPSVGNEQFLENSRYQQEIIFQDYYVAFISARNPLAKKNFVTMDELAVNKFAFTPESRFLAHIPDQFSQPERFLFLHQKEGIMANVAQDNAVTVFPSIRYYNNYYVHTGEVVVVPILDQCIHYDHLLIYPADYRISPSQKIVLDYLKRSYQDFHLRTLPQRNALFSSIKIHIE